MLDKIAKHFDFQQRALNLRAYRTEVLASNIANDETPTTRRWISISARRCRRRPTLRVVWQ